MLLEDILEDGAIRNIQGGVRLEGANSLLFGLNGRDLWGLYRRYPL